ncbi:hypothetical protein O6H91_01G164600 [Diphasiastrum complanatum]|uniref:Uncharacterized protein n=1 Tax=Diphasiastrum complanatum TaxID=34168 RepID=A0ACC2EYA9_DIPCM|nr:hypothetical protein O6H91_01G164600 [Diphasiastrum complanatum]
MEGVEKMSCARQIRQLLRDADKLRSPSPSSPFVLNFKGRRPAALRITQNSSPDTPNLDFNRKSEEAIPYEESSQAEGSSKRGVSSKIIKLVNDGANKEIECKKSHSSENISCDNKIIDYNRNSKETVPYEETCQAPSSSKGEVYSSHIIKAENDGVNGSECKKRHSSETVSCNALRTTEIPPLDNAIVDYNRKPEADPYVESCQAESSCKRGVYSQRIQLQNGVNNESECKKNRSSGNIICNDCSEEKDLSEFGIIDPFDDSIQVTKIGEAETDSFASAEEFFDAPESPAYGSSIGDQLLYDGQLSSMYPSCTCNVNLSYLDEFKANVERCVSEQRALVTLKQQHEKVAHEFSLSRFFSIPSDKQIIGRTSRNVFDLSDQIGQILEVTRFVACAIAKGTAKAEAEEELASIMDCKNREISRLRDKLQYYETLNHEMSHRNQECIEITRRQRQKRRRRLRLTLGCLGGIACLGMSAAAVYRYFPWDDFKAWRSSHSIKLGESAVEDAVAEHEDL